MAVIFDPLSNRRSQRVSIDDAFSLVATLLFGIPQGSVIGLILFSIYTLPIGDIARAHGLNVNFYADDTQLYMAFHPTDHEDTTLILIQVENCIKYIRIRMVENKLKLSDDKTEVLILTFKLQRSIHCISQVVVRRAPIAPTLTVHNLGAMFDQSFTMDVFVKHICKAAYFPLYNIIFKVLLLTSKALNNLATDYLTLLLDTYKPQRQLRSSDSYLLTVPD
jgi:hypothetical protein